MKESRIRNKESGFTLFIAMVVMGVLMLIAAGIASLAVRQSLISYSARESQYAFYAADTGIDCAIYWDISNPSGVSAFATSSSSDISCNGTVSSVGGSSVSTIEVSLSPDPYCAEVTVTKEYDGGVLETTVESLGYNTCDTDNPRRVERAVRATY